MRIKKLYKTISVLLFMASLLFISFSAITNITGSPDESSGAPGDGNCTSCHTGTAIQSAAANVLWNNVVMTSNIPVSGYVDGTTYNITISYTHTGDTVFGFQTVALDAINSLPAGTVVNGTNNQSHFDNSNSRTYLTHSSSGTSGSGGKSWTFQWTAPNPAVGDVIFYTAICDANGDHAVTGDLILLKPIKVFQTGTAPSTAEIASDKDTVCQNDTVHFTGTGLNGPILSWTWVLPNGSPGSSNVQNPVVVFTSSGTKTVQLTTSNANGQSIPPAFKSIVVLPAPNLTVTPSGNQTICGNDSLTLVANAGANIAYLWTPGNLPTQSVLVKNTGTFKVKATNTLGCSSISPPVNVTKRSIPTVSLATSKDSICIGDSVVLNGTTGFARYIFMRDTILLQDSSLDNIKLAPASSASSYSVTIQDNFGCYSQASNNVMVNIEQPLSAPAVSCDSFTVSYLRFKWTAVGNAQAYQVSTDSAKTWKTPSSGSLGLTHAIAGLPGDSKVNLMVRATKSTGKCGIGNAGSATCQTSPCSAVTFGLEYDSIACSPSATDSISVKIKNASTSNYYVKVDEVNSSGTVIKNIHPYAHATSYTVNLSTSNGVTKYHRFSMIDSNQYTCPGDARTSAIKTVVVLASPALSITLVGKPSGKNIICDKEVANFTFTRPTGTDKYNLLKNGVSFMTTGSSNITLPSSTFNNKDSFSIIAIDTATGCSKSTGPFVIMRYTNPKAAFSYVADTSLMSVVFTDLTPASVAWRWNFGDLVLDVVNKNPTHTYTVRKNYTVTLSATDSNTCLSDTASQGIQFVGLALLDGSNLTLEYFPNPVKSDINIRLNLDLSDDVKVTVMDIQGRIVKKVDFQNQTKGEHTYNIDLSDLSKGAYMMVVGSGDARKAFALIKE